MCIAVSDGDNFGRQVDRQWILQVVGADCDYTADAVNCGGFDQCAMPFFQYSMKAPSFWKSGLLSKS